MLERRGTTGVIFARRSSLIFSRSSHLYLVSCRSTIENENKSTEHLNDRVSTSSSSLASRHCQKSALCFARRCQTYRTHDSGMLVEAIGSSSGRTSSFLSELGNIPTCWCCSNACPNLRGWSVRVSAAKYVSIRGAPVSQRTYRFHQIQWRLHIRSFHCRLCRR